MLLRVGDLAIVVLSGLAVYAMRFGTFAVDGPYRIAVVLATVLTLMIFHSSGIYRSWRGESLVVEIARVWVAWAGVLVAMFVLNWMMKTTDTFSRLWVGGWFAGAAAWFALHRFMSRCVLGYIRAHGVDSRRVILIGSTRAGRKIVEATRHSPWMGFDVIGYFATPHDQVDIDDLPRLGDMEQLVARGDTVACEQFWVAVPMHAEDDIHRIVDALNDAAATVRLVPDLFGYQLLNHQTAELGGVPVITLRRSRVTGHARVVKAVEDRILSAMILVLISPVMLLVALGVKRSSPGPLFYRQRRVGMDGREFQMLKFRSMPVDSEKAGVRWGDARNKQTTRFGRFIRKTSLDELPQFINVLKGDMSIVGPRPERPMFVQSFRKEIPQYMQKHLVKAGITGWAQVNGWRGDTDLNQRIRCDLFYIRNWSVALDLRIIIKTALTTFFGKHAS
ncbi:MAG TPA: undecaprenyl-phosphate glucose phosphotransferase [Oleiagrimonas sp.]|nr:undecaprenyl-phosphate glucose phosphotransferase [Oleiagrimonas sp.]